MWREFGEWWEVGKRAGKNESRSLGGGVDEPHFQSRSVAFAVDLF